MSPPLPPTTTTTKGETGRIGFIVDPVAVFFLVHTISLEPVGGISPNLNGYIIGTSLRAGSF